MVESFEDEISDIEEHTGSTEVKQGKDRTGDSVVSDMGQTTWRKSGSEQGGG